MSFCCHMNAKLLLELITTLKVLDRLSFNSTVVPGLDYTDNNFINDYIVLCDYSILTN